MESAEMTLPCSRFASCTETEVFPVAVGPAMITRGGRGSGRVLFTFIAVRLSIIFPTMLIVRGSAHAQGISFSCISENPFKLAVHLLLIHDDHGGPSVGAVIGIVQREELLYERAGLPL